MSVQVLVYSNKKNGIDLEFDSLIGGTGITITDTTDDLTISHDAHTGDVTGSTALTIANGAVTNAKAADMAQNTIKGRITASTGAPEDLTAANVRTIINVADGANAYVHPNHTGDVTSTGDGATVIADNAVTLAKMAHGTDGNLITYDATGAPAFVSTGTANQVLTSNGAGAAPTFQNAASGFSDPMTTRGDIIIRDATNTTARLAVGTNGQVLTSDGTDISWGTGGGGDTVVGTQTKFISGGALYPGGANPATGPVIKQFGANNQPIQAIEFPDGADYECYLQDVLENWDAGTIKVKAFWFRENDEATPESKTIEFEVSGVSLANFAAIGGTAYGTAVAITDTTDSTDAEDKINITAASSAITIAGAGASEWVSLKIMRDDSAGTITGSIFLAGISVEYTISTGTSTI